MSFLELQTSDASPEVALSYERTARRAAEASNRRKDQFVATVAHELRQPLTPMLMALDLMKRRVSRDHGERARQVVERQLAQLVRLVDDLLEATRISEAKVRLQLERMDLRAVLQDAFDAIGPVAHSRRQAVRLVSLTEEVCVDGDRARLLQVFANLLSNASKFSPPGSFISILVDTDQADVRIAVEDQGRGIDADTLPHVFDIFRQSTNGENGGLGIGLHVVRGLVELHGGTVEAKSAGVGLGSAFTVRLPRSRFGGKADDRLFR